MGHTSTAAGKGTAVGSTAAAAVGVVTSETAAGRQPDCSHVEGILPCSFAGFGRSTLCCCQGLGVVVKRERRIEGSADKEAPCFATKEG